MVLEIKPEFVSLRQGIEVALGELVHIIWPKAPEGCHIASEELLLKASVQLRLDKLYSR
jgi:hypothetical protein